MSENYRTVLDLSVTKHGEPISEDDREALLDAIRDVLELDPLLDTVDITYEDDERIA